MANAKSEVCTNPTISPLKLSIVLVELLPVSDSNSKGSKRPTIGFEFRADESNQS